MKSFNYPIFAVFFLLIFANSAMANPCESGQVYYQVCVDNQNSYGLENYVYFGAYDDIHVQGQSTAQGAFCAPPGINLYINIAGISGTIDYQVKGTHGFLYWKELQPSQDNSVNVTVVTNAYKSYVPVLPDSPTQYQLTFILQANQLNCQ